MKKKIISMVLSMVMCMSAITCATVTVEATTCSREKISVQNNLSLGKGEQVPVYVYTTNPKRGSIWGESWNEDIAITDRYLSYTATAGGNKFSIFNVYGKKVGNTALHFCETSLVDGGDNDDAITRVKVYNAPSSITLNCETVKMGKGESMSIQEHTNAGSYAHPINLKWLSSDTSVGTVRSFQTNTAMVTGRNVGKFKATVKTYNGQWDSAAAIVYNAPTSVKLSRSNLNLIKGMRCTISESTNSGSYANASNLKWSSSNSRVATVVKGGGNKATVKAVGKGTAYVKIKTYNGKTATCKVTVK